MTAKMASTPKRRPPTKAKPADKAPISETNVMAAARTLTAALAGDAPVADGKRAQATMNGFVRQRERQNNERARELGFRSTGDLMAKAMKEIV